MRLPGHKTKSRTQIAAALLAILFVVSQLHLHAHFGLVHHEVCPVSGELVHGTHAHAPSHDAGTSHGDGDEHEEADEHEESVLLSDPTGIDEHGEHCLAVQFYEQRRLGLWTQPVVLGPPRVLARATCPALQEVARRLRPLSFAPKQSPPAPA